MKPIRTLEEAKALADARRRQQASQQRVDPARDAALAKWRAPFALTRWMAQRQVQPTTDR